jgi:hypothetical protein
VPQLLLTTPTGAVGGCSTRCAPLGALFYCCLVRSGGVAKLPQWRRQRPVMCGGDFWRSVTRTCAVGTRGGGRRHALCSA